MEKNHLIESGIYSIFLKQKSKLFEMGVETYNKENYLDLYDMETIKECFKIFEANRKRKKYGLEQMIKWCFVINESEHYKNYKMIFGTLTFDNDTLESTSKTTRRRYVGRFLASNCESYIANIDFGKTNNREHYHFVALCKNDIEKNSWKYGFDSYREIKQDKDSLQKAKKYLLKLNNHSYKDTTKNERVIMNKQKKGIDFVDVIVDTHYEIYRQFKVKFIG